MAGCCSIIESESLQKGDQAHDAAVARRWLRLGFAALIASQSMIFGIAVNESPPEGTEKWVLHGALAVSALLVFFLAGLPLVRQAISSLRQKRIGIEHMFLLGIFGAFFASLYSSITGLGAVYYEVVAVLVAIYTLGTLVTVNRREAALRASDSLRHEFDLCLRLTCCGKQEQVPVAEVRKGDQVVILSGQGVPVDGVVREGRAFVQETALTGEPFPVVKQAGDRILAGSHVLDERLLVEVSQNGKERQLDRLLGMVAEARLTTSGIQKQADLIIRWFMPSVMIISALTFVVWSWLGKWEIGLFNSLAVLVVACPCAMGLATPIGIWNTLNAFARRGLVVHTGELIERLSGIDTVVFDKTGTLSEEKLQLVEMVVLHDGDREMIQRQIVAIQNQSTHPVAKAFQNAFGNIEISPDLQVTGLRVLPGIGIEATVHDGSNSRLIALGNKTLLDVQSSVLQKSLMGRLKSSPESAMDLWVCLDGKPVAVALLREILRDSSQNALRTLARLGIRTQIMSGDRSERLTALGFEGALAGLLPEEKASKIREMQENGARVLFVGDGVNDAPAMMAATAGIALASGADLTQSTAQARLYGGDLMLIPSALALSAKVTRGIRRNLLFAGFYNLVGISLAVAGVLHPVAAALLMLASSLTVTWRALRFGTHLEKALAEALEISEKQTLVPSVRAGGFGLSTNEAVLALAVVAQGILITVMAGINGWMAGLVWAFFGLMAGVIIILWRLWRTEAQGKLLVAMFALGNVGMLVGWWGDVGFGSVIAHGSCVCGCFLSHMGMGKLWSPSWMQGGMLLMSMPLAWSANVFPSGLSASWKSSRWVHALVCLSGMMLGMWLAELLLYPVTWSNPFLHFVSSYLAMTIGMLAGMVFFCRLYLAAIRPGVKS